MSFEEINGHIQVLYKEWSSLQPLSRENEDRLWKKIRLEWNYNSNRIEGNTLTYSETELLLIHGRVEGGHPIRDYEEMKAHNVGINKVREFAEDKEYCLTEADIRSLNLIILKEPFWEEAETPDGQPTRKQIFPGRYKNQPNHVRTATGEIFKFALPEETPAKMRELMEWFRENIESHPASIAVFLAELHHRFILIHPFDDGNGRIVRLWINYALMRFGYPPLVIKSEDREGYIAAIQKADTGNIEALAVYLGKSLISWLETGINAAKGESISEPGDIGREVDIFIRKEKAQGLKKLKPLSEQVKKELCVHLFTPLFETFKNRFEQFNELFNSNEILIKAPRKTLDYLMCFIIDEGINFEVANGNMVNMQVSYIAYRPEKPFDMGASVSVTLHQFEYRLEIRTYFHSSPDSEFIEKEKTYEHISPQSEIEEFVAEGKKLFFEKLKRRAEETAMD